jgi:hypothetical protein
MLTAKLIQYKTGSLSKGVEDSLPAALPRRGVVQVHLVALQRSLEVRDMVRPESSLGKFATSAGVVLDGGTVVVVRTAGEGLYSIALDAKLGVGAGKTILP